MTINIRMDKQTVVYSYNKILYRNENEQTTATHNMDESHNNIMSCERCHSKEYIQYDSIYIKFKTRQS